MIHRQCLEQSVAYSNAYILAVFVILLTQGITSKIHSEISKMAV